MQENFQKEIKGHLLHEITIMLQAIVNVAMPILLWLEKLYLFILAYENLWLILGDPLWHASLSREN